MTPTEFFQTIFCDTKSNVNLRAILPGQDPVSEFVRPDGVLPFAQRFKDRNIYFGCATRDGGGKKEHIREIPVLWVDIDFNSTTPEEADRLIKDFPLLPSFTILSGGGYHLYWRLRELAGQGDILRVESILRGLAKVLKGDPGATDASRVMRVPGSFNVKLEYGDPRLVQIVQANPERQYDLSDFDHMAGDAPPATKPPTLDIQAWVDQCAFLQKWERDAATLPEPEWYAGMSILARWPGGIDYIHWVSSRYPGYSRKETEEKIFRALNEGGPRTCAAIRETVWDCEKDCGVTSPYLLDKKPQKEDSGTAAIYVSGDLPKATNKAWDAIRKMNVPPVLFQYGGVPVRLGKDENDRPAFEILTVDRTRHVGARAISWKSHKTNREVHPPLDVIRDMLATPSDRIPLPVVSGIAEVPTFSETGILCDHRGYNPENRVYYSPPPGLEIPPIPEDPTEEDVRQSIELLLEPLADFPFESESDRANAVGLGFLPYIREIVGPLTPIHLFEAPIHGSGKTLAARMILTPALGNIPFVIQADDDELRKRITALILSGKTVFFLDNVTRELSSSTLANSLTSPYLTDRILGKSMEISVPNRMVWVITANNISMSGEIARRTIRARIDPNTDRPWLREGFRIPNLETWILSNRGRLIGAALTIIRRWVADGMPPFQGKPLGGFERWSRMVGGILECAGIKGFLGNLDELYETVDNENAIWREFVDAWWKEYGDEPIGTRDLFPLAEKIDGLDLGTGSEKSQKVTFGKLLQKKRNTVVGEHRITPAGTKGRLNKWRLISTRPGSAPPADPEPEYEVPF